MNARDEWGRDPAVRFMRRVFGKMESVQYRLLEDLSLSSFDERVRPWRERALVIFERMWSYAAQEGISMDEEKAADIYVFSLARVMGSDGIEVPESLVPRKADVSKIYEEAFR